MDKLQIIELILDELKKCEMKQVLGFNVMTCETKDYLVQYNIELMRLMIRKDQKSELLNGEQANNPFLKEIFSLEIRNKKRKVRFSVGCTELNEILNSIKNR